MHGNGDGNPHSKTLRVRSADGAEADLQLTCPSDARVGILWLPALGVTARHYQPLATALAEQGVATAVHEWRGAGSSNVRASRRCDWGYRELLEQDIPASLDAAREACPDLKWILAGHSLGGQFAALFAALHPQSAEGFAFAASGSPYWRTLPGRMRFVLRAVPLLVHVVTMVYGYYPGKRLGFAGSESRQLMRDWARTTIAGSYQDYLSGRDSEHALANYPKPVLGIRLSDDKLCPPESFEWLMAKFRRASIERAVLSAEDFPSERANHFSWLKDPHPVASEFAQWLQGRI
jgi:predicted alpha/beta hydrolase